MANTGFLRFNEVDITSVISQQTADKATKQELTSGLANKVDSTQYNQDKNTFALKTALTEGLAGKLDKTGTASKATTLATPRNISIKGDVNGTATAFDGSKDISIQATVATMGGATDGANGSKGLVPAPAVADKNKFLRGDGTWQVPTDTKVTQTVKTDNVEYPLLSKDTNAQTTTTSGASFAAGVTVNPSTKTVTAVAFKGTLAGNAYTATKLASPKTIAITGAVTGTATAFDGSANITISATAVAGANVTGTVGSATKATQDGAGNVIASTYALKSDSYTKQEVDAKVSSVYRYKSTVANVGALPKDGNVIGDTYNVEDTGANYAWDGSKWDKLSETIDLTPYLTKAEAGTTYVAKTDYTADKATFALKSELQALQTKVTELQNQLANYATKANPVVTGTLTIE